MLEVVKNENTEIEFIKADMNKLSFIDARFDVVFSSLAVHYIEDFNSFTAGVRIVKSLMMQALDMGVDPTAEEEMRLL